MNSYLGKSMKQELLNYLSKYYLGYRDKVTFDSDITFGVEVEVLTKHLYYPAQYCDNIVDLRNRVMKKDMDYIVAYEDYDDMVVGGELISPILINLEDCWQNLKSTVEEFIKYTGDAQITYHTAGHIHLGHDILKEGDLVKLVKLYAAFEPIIFRFAAGEFLNIRAGATSYAKPIAKKVKDFTGSDEDMISKLCFDGNVGTLMIPFKYNGLNLSNLISGNDTLEFRVPNGTLSLPIWQNNVNFFAHLLMAVNNYDEELIDYYLSNLSFPFNDRAIVREYNKVLDFDRALELADIVFTDELDKLYFLRQYLKDGKIAPEEIINGYQLEKSAPFVR